MRFEAVRAVVDSGAAYTRVPRDLLDRLGVIPDQKLAFVMANGNVVERDVGEARIRLDGRERTRLVVFGDEGSQPLLGADTLEGFALSVAPLNRRLVPIPVLPMA